MIELHNICKTYKNGFKQTEVLKGIDLAVKEGEFLAVMGPSGSGKSTLLNILGGLDFPTEGEYLFQGEEVHKFADARRNKFRKEHVGFVFQDYGLLDDATLYENIELPLSVRNVGRAERKKRIGELIELFHLEGLAKKYPSALSGGEQQRCAIARAIAAGNDLLLADEPTGALDSHNGAEVMQILSGLNREQKLTVVIVTHDNTVAACADRIVHLQDGRLLD